VTATPVSWNQLIPAVDGGYMLPAMPDIVSEIRMSWTAIAMHKKCEICHAIGPTEMRIAKFSPRGVVQLEFPFAPLIVDTAACGRRQGSSLCSDRLRGKALTAVLGGQISNYGAKGIEVCSKVPLDGGIGFHTCGWKGDDSLASAVVNLDPDRARSIPMFSFARRGFTMSGCGDRQGSR
jgi:hypothetical protein